MTQTTGRGDSPVVFAPLDARDVGHDGPLGRAIDRARAWALRPWAPEIVLAVLALAFYSWRVGRPSPWWDEAITRDVVSRPTGAIIDLVGRIDLVHATYYLLVHGLLGQSASITSIRMISVVAAALTTVVLVRLGRELGSPRVGVLAGTLWLIAPLSTRYAQEARPYALVALVATLATLAVVRLVRKPWQRRHWLAYVLWMIALGLLNVVALLLVVVHLGYVAAVGSDRVRRRWGLAATGTMLALGPLLIASVGQREQVAWLPRPGVAQLTGFLQAEFAATLTVIALLVLAVVGLARRGDGHATHGSALALGLTWSLVPTLLLWSISQLHPLFDWRYVFFTVPGTALALASIATLLSVRWVAGMVLVLVLGGWQMQTVYRDDTSGHSENIRGAAEVVEAGARPGDAVLFLPSSRRVVKLGYPEAFSRTDDVALAESGERSGTLFGVESRVTEYRKDLKERARIWVVTGPTRYGESRELVDQQKQRLLDDGFVLRGVSASNSYEVRLYVRQVGPPIGPAQVLQARAS